MSMAIQDKICSILYILHLHKLFLFLVNNQPAYPSLGWLTYNYKYLAGDMVVNEESQHAEVLLHVGNAQ